jgi:hypothetical protein
MRRIFGIRPEAWRAGATICAALTLAALAATAWGQRPPITIPPANQISPPPAPPRAAATSIRPAARSLLPTSIETLRDPLGAGIVISGDLSGSAESALSVLAAIFAYSEAFDPSPNVRIAVADRDDRSAQALFTATVQNVPVIGIAVVALHDDGGEVAVLYDYPDAFEASLPRLRQALATGNPTRGALATLHLADGGAIGLLPGWRVIGQGPGLVDLAGPEGGFLSLGDTIPVYAAATDVAGSVAQAPCCDPVAAFRSVFPQLAANALHRGLPPQTLTGVTGTASTTAPVGGQAAFILATVSVGGRPYAELARAETLGGFIDPWMFRLSAIMAPQPVFDTELPALLDIWRSFSGNPPDFADRVQEAVASIGALRPLLQPAAGPRSLNVPEAWGTVIAVGYAGTKEADPALAAAFVDRLTKENGQAWHPVPAADFK